MMRLIVSPYEEHDITDLVEGKGLHSMKSTDDVRQRVIDAGFDFAKGEFHTFRRKSSSKFYARYTALSNKFLAQLKSTTKWYLNDEISYTNWTNAVKANLKEAYSAAFKMGLESAGTGFAYRKHMSTADTNYVNSAVRQELIHLNKLLGQIRKGSAKGNIDRRLGAYSETLKHIYYAGRVVGSPSNMIVDWISPLDRATCKGCRFLSNNSPYLKDKLPSTPRAGDTPCLNNCRCRLVMRVVGMDVIQKVRVSNRASSYYSRRLSAIKANK